MKIKLVIFALFFITLGALIGAYKLQSPNIKATEITSDGNGKESSPQPSPSGGDQIISGNNPTPVASPSPAPSPQATNQPTSNSGGGCK